MKNWIATGIAFGVPYWVNSLLQVVMVEWMDSSTGGKLDARNDNNPSVRVEDHNRFGRTFPPLLEKRLHRYPGCNSIVKSWLTMMKWLKESI